ncbi:MAG: translation initiation factor IF-2 [Thiofilum sp.]|uniref:translation initiation factor IF-2 n=1 Tax=Thiofilum sp. TaxID=2212733 RepID=UPI0025CC65BF|nr:translation initiation factor IF-2 [Thiofilum sp.]MBK8455287.1 translation initiation factor IF-2 [Thiofilum sp.]
MSDIAVRKLAEMIKAPVEVLLRHLQDAGIRVTGPDDSITDQQKLMLLEKMKQNPDNAVKKGTGKMTIQRRASQESTHAQPSHGRNQNANKTVNVEVRRKKVLNRNQDDNASVSSVAAAKAQELEAARKVRLEREEIIRRAEQERRELQSKRMAGKPAVATKGEVAKEPEPVEPVVAPETKPTVVVNTPSVVTPTPEVLATQVETPAKPVAEVVKAESKPSAPVAKAPEVVAPAPVSVPAAPAAAASTDNSATDNDQSGLTALEQREAVVAAARQEAATALKRRPSRPKPKAKPSLAPRTTIVEADDEVEPVLAKVVVPSKVVVEVEKTAGEGRTDKKKGDKKPARSKNPRDRDDVIDAMPMPKGKGGKKQGRKGVDATAKAESKHGFERPTAPVVREIEIPSTIVVSDLAQKLAIRATDIIKAMMKMGTMVTINQTIDQDTAILVTEELGHKATAMKEVDDASLLAEVTASATSEEVTRPPVVTIMGHVDHGKTSLLDYIRKTRVAAGEAGGITQHIGAYHVETERGTVTFLDTPGHAAFSQMRARGAQVTDIVVLIVAADDGVMPQTKEAIKHARDAQVPIVVAISKIDKPQADPEKVLSELAQNNVLTEEWGGDVPVVRVSGKSGQGVDDLLETLLLVAEIQELKASIDAPAKGHVIEASMERGRGAVATVLVREGTLRRGDILLCGSEYGRVRAMFDERGRSVKEAGPSIPVAVLGLTGAPQAGDEAIVVTDERKAREIAELRKEKQRDTRFAAQNSAKLDMFNQIQAGATERAQLNLIVKADVQGSVEALRSELVNLSTSEIEVRVIASGVGGLTENDIEMALTSKAIVIAFNVRANSTTRKSAQDSDIEIRYYSIIYDVINDVKDAMSGMLSPETREVFIGLAEVRNVFRASGFGQVAGCLVTEGVVRRGSPIRVLRNNVVIFTGELESLRRHRDDVKEVQVGTECGIAVKDYNDVQVGDQIEVFEKIEVARKIA